MEEFFEKVLICSLAVSIAIAIVFSDHLGFAALVSLHA